MRESWRESWDPLHDLPIHDVFAQFQHVLQPLFRRDPVWTGRGEPAAADRGTLLMALSNKFGALVLTTGNKSEMSTGYCTLYGDMVGALAVIGDVMNACTRRAAM